MALLRRLQPTTSTRNQLYFRYLIPELAAEYWMPFTSSLLDRVTLRFGSLICSFRILSKYELICSSSVILNVDDGMVSSILATRHLSVCRTDSRISCATTRQLALFYQSRTSDLSLLCRFSFPCERGITTCEYVFAIQ